MEKLLIKLCKKFKNIYQNIILDLLIKKKQFGNNIKKCNPISFCTLLEKGLERSENQLDFIYRLIRIIEDKYSITIL